MKIPGIEKAWQALSAIAPEAAAKNAMARYADGRFTLRSMGMEFALDTGARIVRGADAGAEEFRSRMSMFLDLLAVWYMGSARDIGLAGRHLKPQQLKGGHHFFKGAHELPLDRIAERYNKNKDGFIERAASFGGEPAEYGDSAAVLYPAPRIPLTLILWQGDVEFPPRADLLFDASAEYHAPLDILWCAAMLATMAML